MWSCQIANTGSCCWSRFGPLAGILPTTSARVSASSGDIVPLERAVSGDRQLVNQGSSDVTRFSGDVISVGAFAAISRRHWRLLAIGARDNGSGLRDTWLERSRARVVQP